MPYYVIKIELDGPRGSDSLQTTVDAFEGAFAIYMPRDEPVDAPLEGAVFEPEMPEEDAIDISRKGVLNWLLLYQRKRRMTTRDARIVDLLRYPFWVYYYQRRRGLIDLRIIDAVSGDQPGAKTKHAIVRAFQRDAEQEQKGPNT